MEIIKSTDAYVLCASRDELVALAAALSGQPTELGAALLEHVREALAMPMDAPTDPMYAWEYVG